MGLRSFVFLRSFQEKKVTGAGEASVLNVRIGGLWYLERKGELTNKQEGVVDEEVADGPGCEAGVAVAEDDHDHPCSAEVGL